MKKILIIQTAFIGDVVLATALVEKIKTHYPTSEIHFLLRKGNESLLKNHPKISKIFIWNKKSQKVKNLFQLIFQIRTHHYDYVINCQRFLSSGWITFCSKAKHKIGFNKNPLSSFFDRSVEHFIGQEGEKKHEVQRNHELIAHFTDSTPALPKLYPSKEDFSAFSPTLPYICIAPASVWFTKQLPKEKWIELTNKINSTTTIYLIGAPSDSKTCHEIKSKSNHPKIEILAGTLSLLQSAALMSQAQMNYVNDSAPLHMASAMNAPVTAVFCSTIPNFGFTPLSSIRRILETKKQLDCRPCGLHGFKKCPKGHFDCSKIIID